MSLPKLLVLELWGLGDLTFATTLIGPALQQFEVTLLAKPHAVPLLQPSFPTLRFVTFDAPWTAFRNKYQLRRWPWSALASTINALRSDHFDAAVSVRRDPRDHLLMWLTGARARFGFPRRGSQIFLSDTLPTPPSKRHRAEDWRQLGKVLATPGIDSAAPRLDVARYGPTAGMHTGESVGKPILCIHPGARIPVRRWPEPFFAVVLEKLREQFDLHIRLITDLDGYGATLAPLADQVLGPLNIGELVCAVGTSDVILCNDSGPAHIAAACGRPVVAIFGPGDVDWFPPWGTLGRVVARDICPWRPCFDYCHFSEPHCLTKLTPFIVLPEIVQHIEGLLRQELKSEVSGADAQGA